MKSVFNKLARAAHCFAAGVTSLNVEFGTAAAGLTAIGVLTANPLLIGGGILTGAVTAHHIHKKGKDTLFPS